MDLDTTLDVLTLTFNRAVDTFVPDGSDSIEISADDGDLLWATDGGVTILGNTVQLSGVNLTGSTGTTGTATAVRDNTSRAVDLSTWDFLTGATFPGVTIHG